MDTQSRGGVHRIQVLELRKKKMHLDLLWGCGEPVTGEF